MASHLPIVKGGLCPARPRRSAAQIAIIALAALGASCAADGAHIKFQRVPGFEPTGHSISVFGVFKDGRMSPGYWKEVGPPLATALGGGSCEAGFGERLADEEPELYAKIDAATKDDGVTEEVLDEIASRATGDTVLVVLVFGKPPPPEQGKRPSQRQPPQSAGIGGGRRGGGGRGGRRGGPATVSEPEEERAFEIAGLLYSPRERTFVAHLGLRYTGSGTDEPIRIFATRLHEALPGVRCAGWVWH